MDAAQRRQRKRILSNPERLAALARTGLMVPREAPGEPVFDELAMLAARVVSAPVALVSLVGEDEQHFIGATGVPGGVRRAPLGLCQFVVAADAPLVIPNVPSHPDAELRANPAIDQFGIVAYCGIPLHLDGAVVGALYALDRTARAWSERDVEVLLGLASLAQRELHAIAQRRQEALVPLRFAQLLNALPAGVYVCDATGHILVYNDRAATLWGIHPAPGFTETEAFSYRKLMRTDGTALPAGETPLAAVLAKGMAYAATELVIGSGQGRTVVLAAAEPLFDIDGSLAGAIGVIHDVSVAHAASRMRDELLELVSHELRTPLTVISGMSSYLARHGPEAGDEAKQTAAAELVSASRRMERVLGNMLQLSRLASDSVEPEPILAQAILDRALVAHRSDFPRTTVLQVGGGRDLIANAVENWSVFALANLLHNAERHGDSAEPPRIEIALESEEVHFRVSNAGVVLSEDEYGALFQPFYRRAETRRRVPGTGLGLTTARSLAESQGGRVLAGPRADHLGSTFTLALPVYAA